MLVFTPLIPRRRDDVAADEPSWSCEHDDKGDTFARLAFPNGCRCPARKHDAAERASARRPSRRVPALRD